MTHIFLNGVKENRREKAEAEIKKILDTVFSDNENPVDSVNISNAFQDTVKDLTKENETNYDPHHEYGTAYAKTIPFIKDGKLAYAIILDGNLIGEWEDEQNIFRFVTLTHELVHVADGFRRWQRIGTESFFARPSRKQGLLFHNALVIWEEYDANRFVAEVVEDAAKELEGKVRNDLILGHIEGLHILLEDVHDFVKQSIRDFRFWKLTPTELCYKVTSKICGILILCAYTSAVVNLSNEVKEKMAEIEKLEGYRFLLSANWSKIQSTLEELYLNRKKYRPDLIEKIAKEIDEIVRRCGLEIRDVAEGLYLDVRDIE
jgi:hypothetical protein